MKISNPRARRFLIVSVLAVASLAAILFAFERFASSAAFVTRTWDGGGVTNNWSEAANWSGDTLPTAGDAVVFDGTSVKNAVVDSTTTVSTLSINSGYSGAISILNNLALTATGGATLNDGTINVGTGSLNLGGNSSLTMNGGALNLESGSITAFFIFTINGGTFNGGSGIFPSNSAFGPVITVNGGNFVAPQSMTVRGFNLAPSAGFNHNNGTITCIGSNSTFISSSARVVNNLELTLSDGAGITTNANTTVSGTLTLTEGLINSGTLRSLGPVSIGPSFGSAGQGGGGGNLFLDDDGVATPRPVDFPAGVRLPNLRINDADFAISSNGVGSVNVDDFQLDAGSIDMGANELIVGYSPATAGSPFVQNGGAITFPTGNFTTNTAAVFTLNAGTFSMGSGTALINPGGFGGITINGGTFNAPNSPMRIGSIGGVSSGFPQSGGVFNGNGDLDVNGGFTLSGGTFNAPTGTSRFGFTFTHTPSGTFNHNGGTARFDSPHPGFSMNVTTNGGVETFNNLVLEPSTDNAQIAFSSRTFRANGDLEIVNGRMNAVTFEVAGNVIVGPGADGDNGQLVFIGTNSQSFANNGGLNTTGTWTINKPSGVVTATTSMLLAATQPLNITSGTLDLGDGSDLSVGPVTVSAAGRLVNETSTTITLGGNVVNSGLIVLRGGGSSCPQADTILLRSSVNGILRNWSGSGAFAVSDADIKDMSGTAPIVAYSSTNGGNNGPNWSFDPGCPPGLSISPTQLSIYRNQSLFFTSAGGVGSRTYSLAVNNSGATIDSMSGFYTAGPTFNASDTVRVTDALGATVDATVNVSAGPPTRLSFIVQPTNRQAGQVFSPALMVAVQDMSGNTVASATDPVTISIGNNPGGSVLSGTQTRNAVNGVATFDDLYLNRTGQNYSFVASSGSLTSATSNLFNITYGPATHLGFTVQPTDTTATLSITPPVQVAFLDAFENTVLGATGQIQVSIGNNPSGGILSGTTVCAPMIPTGTCSFPNLSINNAGSGYTLTATTAPPVAPATSTPFSISNTIRVINTNDAGPGSLRQAIIDSNSLNGIQTIAFDIPGPGPYTIAPLTVLPTISQPVVIDGTTQPGFAGTPIVELSGAAMTGTPRIGLLITGGGSTVKGIVINRFNGPATLGVGIKLESGNGNTIQGNYIGTDVSGNSALGNYYGIQTSSVDNLIGGTTPGEMNVISGNQTGICACGGNSGTLTNLAIRGNRIGTNAAGTAGLGNGYGIVIAKKNVTAGGSAPGERNIISGNGFGVQVQDAGAVVRGNFIGTDISGSSPIANGKGITVSVFFGIAVIGGGDPGEGNLIAFNNQQGIDLFRGSTAYVVGNTATIRGNAVHSNGALGIDWAFAGFSGVTPNDPGDLDSIPNYPKLISAVSSAGNTNVQGTLNSRPSLNYSIDFYLNPVCDPTRYGEGATYLGSTVVSTNSSGLANFSMNFAVNASGQFITATATDPYGGTSEFSRCRVAPTALYSISGRVKDTSDAPLASTVLTMTGDADRQVIANSAGNYAFGEIPNLSDYTVIPSKPNYDFTPTSRSYTNLSANQLNQDFVGTKTRSTIRGSVFGFESGSPLPLSGATVTISGTASRSAVVGETYSFSDLPPGSYTVTVAKDGWTFLPPIDVNLTLTNVSLTHYALHSTPLPGRIFYSLNGWVAGINADGTASEPRTARSDTTAYPDVSFDGTRLAYVYGVSRYELASGNADGTGRVLRQNVPGRYGYPKWSPDRSSLLYVAPGSGTLEIRSIVVPETVTTVPIGGLASPSSPGWISANRIVFAAYDGNDNEIYSVNIDGTNLTQLTNNSTQDRFPTVSYDGSRIAYHSQDLGNYTLSVMNADGSNKINLRNDAFPQNAAWSPDGTMLAMVRSVSNASNRTIAIDSSTGTQIAAISNQPLSTPDWAPDLTNPTPVGGNVSVLAGAVRISFAGVTSAGETTVTRISPQSAGSAPNGFVLGGLAYEITTTSAYTAPVQVCFEVPVESAPTPTAFNLLSLMHNENGVLVDRTTSRDYSIRRICGTVTTLSPFALAEQVDPALPSINGYVADSDGNPMPDVPVELTGAENRLTRSDINGFFTFANLIEGESYSVQPKQPGYIFSETSEDLYAITGENSVVFKGTAATFGISGRVTDGTTGIAGVTVSLEGTILDSAVTDANGDYSFNDLPGDGIYVVNPPPDLAGFAPVEYQIDSLLSDATGLDFMKLSPTAAGVSIMGRVTTSDGNGISGARLTLTSSQGTQRISISSPFGYFKFENVEVGPTYVLEATSKRYIFANPTRVFSLQDEITDMDFIADPE